MKWLGVHFTDEEVKELYGISFATHGLTSMVTNDIDPFDVFLTMLKPDYRFIISRKRPGHAATHNLVHHRKDEFDDGLNVVVHMVSRKRIQAIFYDDSIEGKNMISRLSGGSNSPYTNIHVLDAPHIHTPASQDSPGERRTD